MSDRGTPFVLGLPDSMDIVETYRQLALTVSEEIKVLGTIEPPSVEFDPKIGKVLLNIPKDKITKQIDPYELRLKCNCAACIDEIDGR